jgi:hypothetical protein
VNTQIFGRFRYSVNRVTTSVMTISASQRPSGAVAVLLGILNWVLACPYKSFNSFSAFCTDAMKCALTQPGTRFPTGQRGLDFLQFAWLGVLAKPILFEH